MNVCPLVVIREPGYWLKSAKPDECRALLGAYYADARRLRQLKDDIKAELTVLIGANPRDRLTLINVRRAIHNARWTEVKAKLDHLPLELQRPATELLIGIAKQGDLADSIDQLWRATVARRMAEHYREFSDSSAYRAMPLSAPQLLGRWAQTNWSDGGRLGLSKSAYTLLQYVGRAATKTSPFSHFSPVSFARLTQGNSVCSDTQSLDSYATANTDLWYWLLTAMDGQSAQDNKELIENPTIRIEGASASWYIQNGAEETVRRARVNASVTSGGTRERNTSSPTCAAGLCVSDSRPAPIVSAIEALTGKDRVGSAGAVLNAAEIAETRRLAVEFRASVASARVELLRRQARLFEAVRTSLLARLRGTAEARKVESIVVSDARLIREDVIAAQEKSVGIDLVLPGLRELSRVVRALYPHSSLALCHAGLKKKLNQWFPHVTSAPLLEVLYRCLADCGASPGAEVGDVPRLWRWLAAQERRFASSLCVERLTGIPSVGDSVDITGVLPTTPPLEQPLYLSGGFHLAAPDTIIVNHLGSGFGRLIKRYLSYSNSRRSCFCEWGFQNDGSVLDIELEDDVYFHSDGTIPLLPMTIDIPGVKVRRNYPTVLQLRELHVSWQDHDSALKLTYGNATVYCHYNSLLVLRMRPTLTQLLALFCRPGAQFDFGPTFASIDRAASPRFNRSRGAPRYRPRIIAGNHVVLRRACWTWSSNELSQCIDGRSLGALLKSVQSLWEDAGMPRRVFVRCEAGSTSDNRKPQFLDVADPMWLAFFGIWLRRATGAVHIEEALPSANGLDGESGLRSAAEHILHWIA